LDGAARWANQWSSRLPHELLRSGGILEHEGLASLEGRAGNGPDTVREGVGEVGGVVAVLGANGPCGQPRGPMEMRSIQRIVGTPAGPMTIEMWRSSSPSSSSPPPPPPDGPMTKDHGPVQSGWGKTPNHGWHTAGLSDPMERRQGLSLHQSVSRPVGGRG
jgi:hypothetical protein